MPQNLELKALLPSMKEAEAVARSIGARKAGILRQVDTYYEVPSGRLKLREIDAKKWELIYYRRPDRAGSRFSVYSVFPVSNWRTLKRILSILFPVKVVVRKTRRLYLYRNARIHLDSVWGLGSFIEFEVLVTKGKGQARALDRFLRIVFKIRAGRTLRFSYSDLLLEKNRRRHSI